MKKILVLGFLALLALTVPAAGQRRKKKAAAEPAQNVVIVKVVSRIPEPIPTDPKKQFAWRIKWIGLNRMNGAGIETVIAPFKESQQEIKKAYIKYKATRRPKRLRLAYYKDMFDWYGSQIKNLEAMLACKREIDQLGYSDDPGKKAAIKKKKTELAKLAWAFRILRNEKPRKVR